MQCGQYPGVCLVQPSVVRACLAYVVAVGINRLGLDRVRLN